MSEIRGPCPHHEGNTRGSDSYSWNTYKNRGYCQSCGLKTWVGDGGDLMGKHGEHGKAFLIREGGPEITPRKPHKGQGDTMTTPKVGGHYTDFRGIHKSVREFYGVLSYETDTTTEQHYRYPSGGLKIRTEPGKKFTAKNLHLDELFGMNLFPAGCSKMITITEGEEDCMAAYQMLKGGSYINPVVGLPGATPSPKLWEKCKSYLDSFEKIILSVDTDKPGDKLAEKISQIFPGKVYRVNHGTHKDANEILLAGEAASYKSSWWKAKLVKPDTILSDEDDYLKLYEESPDFEYFTTGIPELDSKILGICKGYLTLIQAESGLGKTEFIRYLENRLLTTSNYKFAAKHMEETKLRSLLGLVSYDLGKNVTIKKFIEDGNLDAEVRASIKNITEAGRFVIFDFNEDGSNEDLINQLRYLIHGLGVDYIFIEPIQDAVTGANSSEKEGKLSDLVTRLSNLAAQTGAGIIIVAHQNSDGGSMYSSMITKRAAFKIVLTGDRESEDPIERNRTYLHVKDKNRTALGMGAAGILDFDLESYTLSPELPKEQSSVTRKVDNDIPF